MTIRIRAAVLMLGGAALLSGCGSFADNTSSAPSSTTTSTPTGEPMDTGLPAPTAPSPTWDATATQQAGEAAVAATNAWLRKNVSLEVWWADASRYFADGVAQVYAPTAQSNIPGTHTIAMPTVVPRSSAYLADVVMPTDAGPYTLLLSRDPESTLPNPWLVERITPPPAAGE